MKSPRKIVNRGCRFPAARSATSANPAARALPLPRRVIVTACIGVAAGISLMFAWGTLAPLSGAVVSEGAVRVEGERKIVQHQEGGIVKAVLVRDGDRVKIGQPLIELDNVVPAAELSALEAQFDAEQAKIARLAAERNLAETVTFPVLLTERRSNARIAELLQRESTLFATHKRGLTDQTDTLHKELSHVRRELAVNAQMGETMRRSLQIATRQRQTNETLQQEGFVSTARVLDLQRTETEALSRVQSSEAELDRARQREADLERRLAAARNDYVKAADDELKEANNRAVQLDERLKPARDLATRTTVSAPVAGTVVGLRVHTPGAVLGPREALLDIVPANAPLIVEANIRPDDVREIRPGSHADVRLTAYNPRTTPVLDGTVTYLSADALSDNQTRARYYVVRVEIPTREVERVNRIAHEPVALGPGMRAELFIRKHARSAFDYLLEPVLEGIRRSMRD
ncbi:HlyD family type I secretion periplasmic adaptor subunit [Paraburkholderia pallida]|uniref:Membrane fusion protein (MFP) family protein n=1 Tax=Paraburkholderia pallida TaxID=2547399 RepID=A0A4P7CWM0_9BURK|nr:HlyD family type I secretion periplasmic adaptor subunit [Paraburkholderia pallida]QBR00599.1 HlyD family type I secretion periplasmic adaptor subunit [Paraburkholderia pallida]